LIVVLAIASFGVRFGTAEAASGDAKGLKIVIARPFDIVGLDPGFLTESAQVVDNIFETLVRRNLDEKLEPGLALSWKQLDDTTWEFKLREGVTFTNGEPFNAEAVKYSIDRVLDPANNAPTRSYITTVKEVKAVDDTTVHVITNAPDPLIPIRFNRYPTEVVPPKYAGEVGQEKFAQNPVGTGPYKLKNWDKGSSVTLVINESYWGDKPEVEEVTFKAIPEAATRVSALINGEADIITAVPPEFRSQIEDSSTAKLSVVERGGNTVYVGFKTNVSPFDNVKVRQALNHAVDVDGIVKNILQGAAVATNSLIGPKDFGYAGEPEGYSYDPEKARKLLSDAGYPNGFEATLDTVNWYMKNTDVAQAIAEQLKQVGVKVKVNNVESGVYRTIVPTGEQSPMYTLGWSSTNTMDADAAIFAVLRSGEPYSTYGNPDVDALLDESRSSSDQERRRQIYAEIQKRVIADAPRIFLYQENTYYGVSKKLDWKGRTDGSLPLRTIKRAE
jgi:peptide/nickel transport system substrate-binding protein